MSIMQSDFNISSILPYQVQFVLKGLNIGLDDRIEQAAVKFVHKTLSDRSYDHTDQLDRHRQILAATHKKIFCNLGLLRRYGDFFFPKTYRPDRDAFIIAVLCNDLLTPDARYQDQFFPDKSVVERAREFYQEALEIVSEGYNPKYGSLKLESLFIAHALEIKHLQNASEHFNSLTYDDISKLYCDHIHPLEKFLSRETLIGRELIQTVNLIEDDLSYHIHDDFEEDDRPAPRIKLVYSAPPPQIG